MASARTTPSTPRMNAVDALRGLALSGILLVHLQEFYECNPAIAATSAVHTVILAALAGKAFSLMAICFGFSCHVVAGARTNDRLSASGPYVWRLMILAVIGCVHSLLYRGDVLAALACAGLIILPLQVRSNRTLVLLASLCFAQPLMIGTLGWAGLAAHPAFPDMHAGRDIAANVYATGSFADVLRVNAGLGQLQKWTYLLDSGRAFQMLGYAIVGTVLGRIGFFEDESTVPPVLDSPLLAIAFATAAVLACKAWFHVAPPDGSPDHFTRKALATSWSDLLLTLAYLSAFRAAWRTRVRRWLLIFDPLGRMSLSFYVGQSMVFVPVFYRFGLGWCARSGTGFAAVIGVAACMGQIGLAIVWRRHFVHGPLEWLWRAAAKGRLDIRFRRPRVYIVAPDFPAMPVDGMRHG